jgi:hypothetical protein
MVGGLNWPLLKDKKQTMTDLREISSNWFKNRNFKKIQERTTLHTPLCFTETRPSEYRECQAFFPVVRIGSPLPHPQGNVAPPPPFGSKGRDTLACGIGGGGGGPILTNGQTLWYSGTLCILKSLYGKGLCSLATAIQHNFSIYVQK